MANIRARSLAGAFVAEITVHLLPWSASKSERESARQAAQQRSGGPTRCWSSWSLPDLLRWRRKPFMLSISSLMNWMLPLTPFWSFVSLSIAFTRTPSSDSTAPWSFVRYDGATCVYRRTPAFGCGLAAAASLLTGQVVLSAAAGCWGRCRTRAADVRRARAVASSLLSW
ncbi:hypothetical protein PVAP13_3NG053590 [Panicum virgatum]|uniref:Uncharacterized protein n=1 Tax=Panicum virgatum TaxID=38727 RepID=A0A8T0U3E0_PANVG|nr:hypothetical protein PVAP13_3NG053590 [Panicum virgatum]